jgi:type I restriction-modification system DNA methylase subunit
MKIDNNKTLGQFFTPKFVSDFMVSLIAKEKTVQY